MKQVSAFDLDHTLVHTNSSLLFYRYLISKGLYSHFNLFKTAFYSFRHYLFNLSLTDLHRKAFDGFLKGVSLSFVQEEVRNFLSRDFHKYLYLPAFERLRLAQHQGEYTIILSNAPSFIVGPIAEFLEVNEWYSSHYNVDKQGRFESVDSILLGEDKAKFIKGLMKKFNIPKSQITAYSDSDLDLPFLKSAGRPIAANPNSRLLKVSKKKSWEVI